MTYCHVQIYLHRPFLHYLTGPSVKNPGGSSKEDFQKYASTCIQASRNIIYMGEDMNRNGLLFGAEWRIGHMLLTAALSLLYIPLSDSSSTLAAFVMTDLAIAKSLLSALRPYCVRAQRAHLVLTVCFCLFLVFVPWYFTGANVISPSYSQRRSPAPARSHFRRVRINIECGIPDSHCQRGQTPHTPRR
jgi:hypothetical protein